MLRNCLKFNSKFYHNSCYGLEPNFSTILGYLPSVQAGSPIFLDALSHGLYFDRLNNQAVAIKTNKNYNLKNL
jgi:hypothetical protein